MSATFPAIRLVVTRDAVAKADNPVRELSVDLAGVGRVANSLRPVQQQGTIGTTGV